MIYCHSANAALCAEPMTRLSIPNRKLDHIAMGLSGLCLVHCIGTAIVLTLLASATGFLGKPIIHEVGLILAMIIGSIALGRGFLEHRLATPAAVGALGLGVMGFALSLPEGGHEAIYTVCGVMILAFGHHLNIKAHGAVR